MTVMDLLKKYKSVILYLVFGVLTTLVNVATYHTAYELLNIGNVLSTAIAWCVAVLFAFVTNKLFVFESKKKNREAAKEAVSFVVCRVGTGVIEVGLMWLLVDILCFNGTLMKLLTNAIVIIINYFASRFFIFKGDSNE